MPSLYGVCYSMLMDSLLVKDLSALTATHPALAAALCGVDGLSELLQWAAQENLPVARMEFIVQDEFTHDAILAWGDEYVVFGLT
jgi:hypothetical protein